MHLEKNEITKPCRICLGIRIFYSLSKVYWTLNERSICVFWLFLEAVSLWLWERQIAKSSGSSLIRVAVSGRVSFFFPFFFFFRMFIRSKHSFISLAISLTKSLVLMRKKETAKISGWFGIPKACQTGKCWLPFPFLKLFRAYWILLQTCPVVCWLRMKIKWRTPWAVHRVLHFTCVQRSFSIYSVFPHRSS